MDLDLLYNAIDEDTFFTKKNVNHIISDYDIEEASVSSFRLEEKSEELKQKRLFSFAKLLKSQQQPKPVVDEVDDSIADFDSPNKLQNDLDKMITNFDKGKGRWSFLPFKKGSKTSKGSKRSSKDDGKKDKEGEDKKEDDKEENRDSKDNEDKKEDGGDEEKDKDKEEDKDDEDKEEKKEEKKEEEVESVTSEEEEEAEDDEVEEEPVDGLNEPADYDILKDPAFADLETETLFPDDEEEENVLDMDRAEFYDVLDVTIKPDKLKPHVEKKFTERKVIPPFPKGGWTWRPAKFVSETDIPDGEGVVWKLEYSDKDGGQVEVDMSKFSHFVAPFETKTKLGKHHNFSVNDKLDVEDRFISAQSKKKVAKWRAAKVVACDSYWIRVHFLDWTHFWDEWLHVYMDQPRIAKFEKMTKKFQRRHKRQMSNFQKVMSRKRNLHLVQMDADGNCMFRTVAHQIYGSPTKHKKVREECVRHMIQNKKRFGTSMPNFNAYIAKMRAEGTWGDDLEIKAMEEVYDRPFEIYQPSGFGIQYKPIKIHFAGDMPKNIHKVEPVRLSYHGNCHYNSIVPVELKMRKDHSFVAPPLLNSKRIQTQREKLFKKGEKEERRIKREARRKEREEKAKKAAEKEAQEEEEEENKEEKAEEPDATDEEDSKEEDAKNANETEVTEKPKILKTESSKIIVIKESRKSDAESNEKSSEESPPPNENPKGLENKSQEDKVEVVSL